MLSQEQVAFFQTFGYLALRQVYTTAEIAEIRQETDRLLCENRDGRPFPAEERQCLIPFFEHSPTLLRYLADDRIYELGIDLVGPDFILCATEGNLHVGDTRWHGGGAEEDILANIKICLYLEPRTAETGALRIIPGSNYVAMRERLQPLVSQLDDPTPNCFGVDAAAIPVLESSPGDLLIFSESTWHGAFGGEPGRTQHAISFLEKPKTETQIEHTKELYEKWNYSLHPHPSIVASESPRLRGMVQQLVDWGFGAPPPMPIFA